MSGLWDVMIKKITLCLVGVSLHAQKANSLGLAEHKTLKLAVWEIWGKEERAVALGVCFCFCNSPRACDLRTQCRTTPCP